MSYSVAWPGAVTVGIDYIRPMDVKQRRAPIDL